MSFKATLPSRPSHTITSARPRTRSLPSTLPTKLTTGSWRRRRCASTSTSPPFFSPPPMFMLWRPTAPLDGLARLLGHADRVGRVQDGDVLGVVGDALEHALDAALVAHQQALDVGRERDLGDALHDLVRRVVAAHGVDGDGGHARNAPAPGTRAARPDRRAP